MFSCAVDVFGNGFGIMFIFDNGDSGDPISAILSMVLCVGLELLGLASSVDIGTGVVDGVILGSIIRFCRPNVRGIGETEVCSTQFGSNENYKNVRIFIAYEFFLSEKEIQWNEIEWKK